MAKTEKPVSELDTATTEKPVNQPYKENVETKPISAAKTKEETTFVYIGPSLPGGRLATNKILNGERNAILAYLQEIIEEYPSVAGLIVPLSRLAVDSEKARKKGNGTYNRYQGVIKEITAKGVEQ